MSHKHQDSPKIVTTLSIIIMLGLAATAIIYIALSNDKGGASQEVWGHFKDLSILVIGYYFGYKKPSKVNS